MFSLSFEMAKTNCLDLVSICVTKLINVFNENDEMQLKYCDPRPHSALTIKKQKKNKIETVREGNGGNVSLALSHSLRVV